MLYYDWYRKKTKNGYILDIETGIFTTDNGKVVRSESQN